MPKNAQTTTQLHSSHTLVMLKILQARLQQYVNHELPVVQAGFRKGRGTRDQIANIRWIIKKAREFFSLGEDSSSSRPSMQPLTAPTAVYSDSSTKVSSLRIWWCQLWPVSVVWLQVLPGYRTFNKCLMSSILLTPQRTSGLWESTQLSPHERKTINCSVTFFSVLAALCGMWDLSSLTRDGTCAPAFQV